MTTLVIANTERNPKSGRKEVLASHGIDLLTGKTTVLPPVPPEQLGAVFDQAYGEYLIPDHVSSR